MPIPGPATALFAGQDLAITFRTDSNVDQADLDELVVLATLSPPVSADAGAPSPMTDAGRPPPASDASSPPPPGPGNDSGPPPAPVSGWWRPTPGTSWQWQISGALDTRVAVSVYDIDLYNSSAADIAGLQAQGRKVICYFDTSYEPGRPESATLLPYIGNPYQGWPGQYWLDIRQPAVVSVMLGRIDLAKQKGCDAIEADSVDAFHNNPGFNFTLDDQRRFILTLARAAHARGISYGLKNDLDDISNVLSEVDFSINEECAKYNECDRLSPFVAANKAVFDAEYGPDLAATAAQVCPALNARNFDGIVKNLSLDAPRVACR